MAWASKGVDPRLIQANVKFSFKLFAELFNQHPDRNLFISPASVAFALAMAYNGSHDDTQRGIAQTLNIQDLTIDELNHANAALKAQLDQTSTDIQLSLANAMWTREDVSFNLEFLQRNRDFYEAHIEGIDVNDPAAPARINAWVHMQTAGKISEIVNTLDPSTILLLVNAIYFKGKWATAFDKAKTQSKPFTQFDGRQTSHPSMFQSATYPYYRGKTFQAVSLAYGAGRTSLYVFLPDEGIPLQTLIQTLTAEQWDLWMPQFRKTQGALSLPRFRVTYEAELNTALSSLGMGMAFDPQTADFSRMLSQPSQLSINAVKHKTVVDVTEEGTEAAAVTSINVYATSATQPQTFQMNVNRPFFCALRDNETGTLLFLGVVGHLQ